MSDRPAPSSESVRRRFERQGRRDTKPELALRRRLHGMGLRYRVDRQVIDGLRRRADLVFAGPRVAVFVDGCFWHLCPEHGNLPKSNHDWWRDKLEANVARDRDTDDRLAEAGWTVLRVWEHELRREPDAAAARVEEVVRPRGGQRVVATGCD